MLYFYGKSSLLAMVFGRKERVQKEDGYSGMVRGEVEKASPPDLFQKWSQWGGNKVDMDYLLAQTAVTPHLM
jgi:hypothetical protein